jgi:hypothetical protein
MISERGERGRKQSIKRSTGIMSNTMFGQCAYCGKQFNNNKEKEDHIKKVHQ